MCGKEAAKKQDAEASEHRKLLISRGWFTAKYPGTCGECYAKIIPGEDFIHAMPGNQYGYRRSKYVGECCAHIIEGRVDVQ
jgi:hypothetical protein